MASTHELTKAQKRQLRDLCDLTHERDLAVELARLEAAFRRWRASEIDTFELSDVIHEFHQGPSRRLFATYRQPNLRFVVASALHRGVLTEGEIGAELLGLLGPRRGCQRDADGE